MAELNNIVAFVYKGEENLGLEYLAGTLKRHNIETAMLFDPGIFSGEFINIPSVSKYFDKRKKILKTLAQLKPKIVAFSVFTDIYQWCKYLAAEIKIILPETFIIFGGIHPTGNPEGTLADCAVDAVAVGECEQQFLELAKQIFENKLTYSINNIWFKKNGSIIKNDLSPLVEDLDSLEPKDKEIFESYISYRYMYLTMTDRGCPFACSYCSNSVYKKIYPNKSFLRRRSLESVMNELVMVKAKYQPQLIYFLDNVFTHDRAWLRQFCSIYKQRIAIPYTCEIHSSFFDEEIAGLLQESGCVRIKFGVQTFNEEIKKEILNRHEKNENLIKAFDICEKMKFPFYVDHICGIPHEKEEDFIVAINCYKKYKYLKRINFFALAYYPGAQITTYAFDQGLLSRDDLKRINNGEQQSAFIRYGSVEDPAQRKQLQMKKNIFTLLPMIPERVVDFIIKHQLLKMFLYIPYALIIPCEGVLIPLLKKDNLAKLRRKHTLAFYMKNIFRS